MVYSLRHPRGEGLAAPVPHLTLCAVETSKRGTWILMGRMVVDGVVVADVEGRTREYAAVAVDVFDADIVVGGVADVVGGCIAVAAYA